MALVNFMVDLCVKRMMDQVAKPSKEVLAAAAGPALANAALLMAEGCPVRYITALKGLYSANNLPYPDLDGMFELDLPAHSVKTSSSTCDIEIQTVDSTRLTKSVSVQSEPNDNKYMTDEEEYRETQQLDDILRAVEEIPSSLNEMEELLMGIKTVKDLPSTYKKVNDSIIDYDDNCSYLGLEGHPTEFNVDYYALNGGEECDMDEWYSSPSSEWEDWFDEDFDIHSITDPLFTCRNTPTINRGRSVLKLAVTAPTMNFVTPKNSKFKTVSTPASPAYQQRRRKNRPTCAKSRVVNNSTSSLTSTQIFSLKPVGNPVCPRTPLTSTYKPTHFRGSEISLGNTLDYLTQFTLGSPMQSNDAMTSSPMESAVAAKNHMRPQSQMKHSALFLPMGQTALKHSLTRRLY